jgi:hypothetical protein
MYGAEDSEWYFRLTIQIFNLSKAAFFTEADEKQFREVYSPLVESMRECHSARAELLRLIETHANDVATGKCVKVTNGTMSLLEDIEPNLNRLFKDFFVKARGVFYQLFGQQAYKGSKPKSVTEVLLNYDLGFVQMEDDQKFEKKLAELSKKVTGDKHQKLLAMLSSDRRTWASAMIRVRDQVIHNTNSPRLKMTYVLKGGIPRVGFPTINSKGIVELVETIWENLVECVEETVLQCLSTKTSFLVLMKIPEDKRDPNYPAKWCFGIAPAK